MSIRKVLESFLEHVKKLEVAEEEGTKGNFSREFQHLKKKSGFYLRDGTYPAKEGEKTINRAKNRYKDILPFDYTRVILNPLNGEEGSDYINANYLKGALGQSAYIAAQGPLPGTVTDFWRMLWQFNVKIVVMASNEYEAGKIPGTMQHKCQRYWPVEDEEKHFLDMKVTLAQEESHTEFVVRTINVEKGDENRTLLQFHYTSWPDHGVPSSTRPMLDMIALVREFQPGNERPIVIHCSAGCGRTGTICAIDYAWNLLKVGKLSNNFSIYKIVSEMRKQRPSIVQAKEQYVIAHKAVAELFERHLDMMNQHFYENVEFKAQQPLSPGGESPSSDAGQINSSYEDLASPIVRIELVPPAKLLKRRSMIVENATSPTHKSVQTTVALIIKSESDNDLKAGTSQLKCVTPTLETKFSFELEDLDANAPTSPTKITVTDGDSLLPDSSRSDMLSSSSHSVESGYSSNMGGLRGTAAPSSEELACHVTNIHISEDGETQMSYGHERMANNDKAVAPRGFDDSPTRNRALISRGQFSPTKGQLSPTKGQFSPTKGQLSPTKGQFSPTKGQLSQTTGLLSPTKGHLSPTQGETSHTFVVLPGTHQRETCTDEASIPSVTDSSDVDDVVFEENPMYISVTSSANGQFHNVPSPEDKGVKNSHIVTTSSPKKIIDIVSELNKRSISTEEAHDSGNRKNETHSNKKSPVRIAPKPADRNFLGKRNVFTKKSRGDDFEYSDVAPPEVADFADYAKADEKYTYAEAYDESTVLAQPSKSGYCYVDANMPRNPLQAAAQKIMAESCPNEHQAKGSAGAKPKLPLQGPLAHGARKAPAKPPRKFKPSTNDFNMDYEDVNVSADGAAYEPVTVQDASTRGIPKCASSDSGNSHRLHPVALRRQDGFGSSGSDNEDVYAMVEARTHVSAVSSEFTDDEDVPPVPQKSSGAYESSSEESLTNQMPEIPVDLLNSTAGAVRTLGRAFKKKVREAFGGNAWPISNDQAVSSGPAVVIFKGRDISYGNRVSRPAGPRSSSNFTPMPAPRSK